DRVNIAARYTTIEQARQTFYQNPVFGVGVSLRKELDATNIFWVTLAETGVPGLMAFGFVHFALLRMIRRSQKALKQADPRFSLLVVGGAMVMRQLAQGVVDHYWSRG